MNICPECEVEMEAGLELCPDCLNEGPIDEAALEEGYEEIDDAPSACLELEDGYRVEISGHEVLLGRKDPLEGLDPEVDLSIHGGFERGVSRRHAVISRDDSSYVLEDLGSTNGTVLNKAKVTAGVPTVLADGDVIHFGHLKAVFHNGAQDKTSAGGMS